MLGAPQENPIDKPPKVIDTEYDFWDAITDARNQFFWANNFLANPKVTFEEVREIIKKNNSVPFVEYLKKEKNKKLSQKVLSNEECKKIITIYDDLARRMNNVDTRENLMQILEEAGEVLGEYETGLDN